MRLLRLALLLILAYVNPVVAQSFLPAYEMKGSPAFQTFNQALKQDRFLEELAARASAVFELPRPVTVTVIECGRPNAHYRRNPLGGGEIRLCFELFAQIAEMHAQAVASARRPPPNADQGALGFIFMHEVGHAVLDQLQVSLPGTLEDAADAIAAYAFLLAREHDNAWLEGAIWYFSKSSPHHRRGGFVDTHSLDSQRQANVICLAFGKDSSRYASWAGRTLTLSRSAQCKDEYRRLDGFLRVHLGAGFHPDGVRTSAPLQTDGGAARARLPDACSASAPACASSATGAKPLGPQRDP